MIPGMFAAATTAQASRLWEPSDLPSSPDIWLDWSSPVTDESGNAQQIDDLSGNAHHFVADSSGDRPQILSEELNGHRVLRFDDDAMQCTTAEEVMRNTSKMLVIAVAKKRTQDSGSTPLPNRTALQFRRGNGTSRSSIQLSNTVTNQYNRPRLTIRPLDNNAAIESVNSGSEVWGRWALYRWEWNGIDDYLAVAVDGEDDGLLSPLSTSGTTSDTQYGVPGTTLGASWSPAGVGYGGHADMDLAALLVWSSELPDAEDVDRLEGWAAWECGLESNLPAEHPYKEAPPMISSGSSTVQSLWVGAPT